MLYALDEEFMEHWASIELLSIGLVAEDGRTYYRQVVNVDHGRANQFVRDYVLPQLTACPSGMNKQQHWARMSQPTPAECVADCPWQWKEKLGAEIQAFCGESPTFIGYYSAYDWVVLCQLFGTMMGLPKGWPRYCIDLRYALDARGYTGITQPDDMVPHALSNATWIMETWKIVEQREGVSRERGTI